VVNNAGLRYPTTVSQIAVGSKTTEQRQQNTPRLAQTKLALNRTPLGEVRLHIKPPSPPPEYSLASKATTRKPPSKEQAAGKGTAASNTMFKQMTKTISGNQHAADQAITVRKGSPAERPTILGQMSKNVQRIQHAADQVMMVQKGSPAEGSTFSNVNPSKGKSSVNPRKRSSIHSPERPAKAGVTAASTSNTKHEVPETTPPPTKRRKTKYRAPSSDPSSSQSSVHSPWRPLIPLSMARNAGHDFRTW
jgi:hypothetical protein